MELLTKIFKPKYLTLYETPVIKNQYLYFLDQKMKKIEKVTVNNISIPCIVIKRYENKVERFLDISEYFKKHKLEKNKPIFIKIWVDRKRVD